MKCKGQMLQVPMQWNLKTAITWSTEMKRKMNGTVEAIWSCKAILFVEMIAMRVVAANEPKLRLHVL